MTPQADKAEVVTSSALNFLVSPVETESPEASPADRRLWCNFQKGNKFQDSSRLDKNPASHLRGDRA